MTPGEAVAMLDLPSWEHVGALLLSHGVTDGAPRSCEYCPIARFLERITQTVWSVASLNAWTFASVVYPLPDAVRDFIDGYDSGRWAA